MEIKARTTDVPVSTKKNRASEGGGKSLVKFIVRTIIKEMNIFKDGVHRIIFFSSKRERRKVSKTPKKNNSCRLE